MKKITDGKIFQKIITMLLIFVMLSSYLPMLVVFAEDTNESNYADKIVLNVNWQGGNTNIAGTTADTYTLEYNLELNGVPTGFKNVEMYIKTKQINNVYDSVTAKANSSANSIENGAYSHIDFGDKNTGMEIGGSASIKFGNDDNLHEREVWVTVLGKYRDSKTKEEISFKVEKCLNAEITPETQITNYEALLKMQTGNYGTELGAYVRGNEISMGNGQYGSLGWYSTMVTATYPIHIDSYKYTEKLDLNVTINRLCGKESKLSEGYTINWDGLDTVLGAPTQITNEDGSITYTFSKGEDSEKLVKDNTFSINKDFTIIITYTIPNTNPEEGGELVETATNCTFLAEMKSVGYKTEQIYGKEETQEKITKTSSLNKNNNVGLGLYTPGTHAWVNVKFGTTTSSYLNKEDIDNFIKNRNIDLAISADITYNKGDKEQNLVSYITYDSPAITYLSDEGKIVTKTLTANQMRLKQIREVASSDSVSEFVDESTAIEFDEIYNVENEKNINKFQIKMNNFLYTNFYKFYTTYTLNANDLGLSDTELANILTISINTDTNGKWCYGSGTTSFYNTNSIGNKYSYMELDIGEDFSSDVSKKNVPELKNITLRMYKNTGVIKTKENYVINENPIFYLNLPSGFKYKNIDATMTNNSSISIDEDNLDIIRINGEQYLVIPCLGVYDSSKLEEVDINISFTRTLESNSDTGECTIYAYMLTDNERYIYEQTNTLGLSKGEITPEKVFATSAVFNISGSKEIVTKTIVERAESKEFFEPNPSDNVIAQSEKECPMIVDSNDKVTYKSVLRCVGDNLQGIKIISKLPIANNSYIDNSDLKLIEDDYRLPDSFYNDFTIRGFNKGDIITQVSLQNVNNIKVYLQNLSDRNEVEISEDNYTIYYTTQENVNFETDASAFIEYVKGVSDLSQAKNLKVVFNDEYQLKSGNRIIVQYEMTMPDEAGMVGAVTATQYIKSTDTTPTTLYSPAAYVINGNTNGTIVVKKKFEGYNVGVAPSGVSLSGIEFKLQYYDEEEGKKKFLQDSTGADIVATTNENGVATFSNIPYGEYYLYEVTEFDNYSGIGNLQIIDLEAGQTINYVAENKLKRGNITINKEWEDTNEQQGSVKFLIQRVKKTGENISFEPITVTTDEAGIAVAENIPYGTYRITETSGKDGWYASNSPQEVELDAENKEATFLNIPGRAVLQIVKTVPEGETVDGLKFHITGIGKVNYINKEGNPVNNNTDMTVTVGEDYSSDDNISIEKSENDTKATITISNLYLGAYTIDEIEIPVIEGTDIEKYVKASSQVNLNVHNLSNPVTVEIKNNYKKGTLEIQKTAKLKEGDTYTDIGDLSVFKVRITGTSYYGHDVDQLITLDENGYGMATVEIGNYKLTEVAEDGYTTYYGENSQASTTPPTVTIEYNKTTTQKLYNEHTGVGYVRVEKTLEGKTDPQKVIDAGIEFKVVGQNVAGGRVEETIKIDKIDTEKNVAYGVSGPISSGGEYQLEEVESTVPEFFEGIEPVEVDLKTSHTTEAPLVIKAENKRTKGNLEILTQTDPVGGPLVGITYRVTEVEINKNGTYTKIGNSVDVEGNNDTINPSFAELKDINAGYYLVEQLTVPKGWQKDVSQIVEVPSYNTGYANFEITAIKKLQQNKVKINKVILNSQGEIATEEDLEKAELNKNESFEIKLTNIDTKEIFYVFTSTEEPGVIQGLEPGTYKIEEIYKPKYITEGYYNNIEVEPNDIQGLTQNIENTIVEEKIIETDGEYLFTIEQNGNSIEDVELTIKNKINTSFGFGGQTLVDNLSKVDVEEQEIQIVTKAVIYVVDENNNAISGVKFKLVNEQGKVIVLNNKGAEFEISDKRMTIKGLPVGKYTLVCTQYPDGYLKPDDKEIIVYSDAVQVARVEVQKNIPRGTMLLSTVYTTEDNETKYTSRSKYKVVNKSTGELVRFTRTATGDYKKSNLEDASPVIVLKSGPVEIEGIEAGDYEVGIVDVTKGYGIQSELPENVTIEENATENVSVEVVNKEIVQVGAGYCTAMYLNESGELFIVGTGRAGEFGTGEEIRKSQFTKIEFPGNVKISKFTYTYELFNVCAIDTEGRVWTWGGSGKEQIQCITDTNELLYDEYYNKGTRFIDVQKNEYILLLDNKGREWHLGNKYTVHPVTENLNEGITIKKLINFRDYGYYWGAIDSLGRVWKWDSYNNLECISEKTNLGTTEIEDFLIYGMALDKDGNVWVSDGDSDYTKMDSSIFGNARIKQISADNLHIKIAVDEFGKVWTWGNLLLGNGDFSSSSSVPICISDDESEALYGTTIKDIDTFSNIVVAVDSNNRIWYWGTGSNAEDFLPSSASPIIMTNAYNEHLEYNVKFKKVFTEDCYSFAIDEEGGLWAWGYSQDGILGIESYSNSNAYNQLNPIKINIPGNPKVKKVAISRNEYRTIILSEDGRVYICGGGQNIKEVTNDFNLSENSKIVDVYVEGSQSYLALDSEGKAYKWIIDSSSIVRNVYCYSDNVEMYKDKKIIKLGLAEFNRSKYSIALDDKGNLYCLNDSTVNNNLKDKARFIDIEGRYCLDENGKIWRVDDSGNLVCLSNNSSYSIYKNYRTDADYKITELYNTSMYGYYGVTFKDNKGDLWVHTGSDIVKLEGNIVIESHTVNADEIPKDVISMSSWLLVDKYGQIWVYKNISNSNGQAGIGTTTAITHPICLSNRYPKNISYNVKMKEILSDTLVVDENGNLYDYSNGTVNGVSPIDYIEGSLGVKIVDSCGYDETASGIRKIAIDENGKLWEGNNKEVKCLSDLTGTQLAEKYENDSNFKIMKIYQFGSGNYITNYAIDNYGKVWTWGNNSAGQCGNGTTNEIKYPICISDIEDSNLTDINTIESTGNKSVIAKNNNGKVWVWGTNKNGILGDGTTQYITKPYCINSEKLDGKDIKEICINDEKSNYTYALILCTDGSVYVAGNSTITGTTAWSYVGTCEGATNIFYDDIYIVTGENKVWTFGQNNRTSGSTTYYGRCGTGDATQDIITTPTLISEEFEISKVNDANNINITYAIDTNGKLWQWGALNKISSIKGPECLNNSNKIVVTGNYGLTIDEKGNLIKGDKSSDISEVIEKIYGEVTLENISDFGEKVINNGSTYNNICANGKLWKIYCNSYVPSISYKCLNDIAGSELLGKYVVDCSSYKALDSEGNLYVWSFDTGLSESSSVPVCSTNRAQIGEEVFKANNTVINIPQDNSLYGVKIKELINDKFAIDYDNNIWYFTESGKPTNLSLSSVQGDKNPLYGKQISNIISGNYVIASDNKIYYVGEEYPSYVMDAVSEECEYIVKDFTSLGYEYYIALDANGKLWSCGVQTNGLLGNGGYTTNRKTVCLNDIEGTQLYNAQLNDPNFKIEKILGTTMYSVLAIDNSGKLWAWGANLPGSCGSGDSNKILSPVCISNIEGTDLYNAHNNDSTMKIIGIENKGDYYKYLWDSTGELWSIDTGTYTWKKYKDVEATGNLASEFENNADFKISKIISNGKYVLGNNGNIYKNGTIVENISGMDNLYEGYENSILATGNGELYVIYESSSSVTVNKVGDYTVEKVVVGGTSKPTLILATNGKLLLGTTSFSVCNGAFKGANVKDINMIGGTIFIIDENDVMYAWFGFGSTSLGVEFTTEYDEIVEKLYGEVNNDNRKKLIKLLDDNNITSKTATGVALYKADTGLYKVQFENSKLTCTQVNPAESEYIGGIGKIEKVVGEDEIQTSLGKTYKVKATSSTAFTIDETTEVTPFTNEGVKPVEIEGVNIVKQTTYKALDDKGNLYVWGGKYTGLSTALDGIVCLTNEQYYVKPIYSNTNGWSVIKNQF